MRLDRVMYNEKILLDWKISSVTLPCHKSDDHPIMVSLDSLEMEVSGPFKFLNVWIQNPDCRRVMREVWNRQAIGALPYVRVMKKP